MKRCQRRFTIAREKNPVSPGFSPTRINCSRRLNVGGGTGLFSFFNSSNFFFCSSLAFLSGSFETGSSTAAPERNINRAFFSTPAVVLKLTRPYSRSPMWLPFSKVRLKNDFMP